MPTYFPAMRYGGPIHSVHGLCKALVKTGHEVHVYTTNVDGAGELDVPVGQTVNLDGVFVTYFSTGKPRRLYRSPAMFAKLRKTVANFDSVHIHAVFLWPGLAASRAAKREGVPYVVSPRGMLVPELIAKKSRLAKSTWIRLFDRRMIREAAMLHVTSQREAEDVRALGMAIPEMVNIPNGITMPDAGKESQLKPEGYIFCLGRLDPKKNLEALIDAMRGLLDAELLVAGDGESEYVDSLKQRVMDNGLSRRVSFLGHLDDSTKWSYYRNAAVFVLPSRSENFANVVLEAMAVGCPVVVTPGVGLAETVAKHECGLVVERRSDAIAEALSELLASPDLRKFYGQNGKRIAGTQFSWGSVARDMVNAYSSILSSKPLSAKESSSS